MIGKEVAGGWIYMTGSNVADKVLCFDQVGDDKAVDPIISY